MSFEPCRWIGAFGQGLDGSNTSQVADIEPRLPGPGTSDVIQLSVGPSNPHAGHDLPASLGPAGVTTLHPTADHMTYQAFHHAQPLFLRQSLEIGRASCRERE